jgi:uncharacterized lipoprotein YehR (DUF1307 family)
MADRVALITREEAKWLLQEIKKAYERFDGIEKRLDAIETLLKHHAYVGVPEQFRAVRGNLILIMEKLRVKP